MTEWIEDLLDRVDPADPGQAAHGRCAWIVGLDRPEQSAAAARALFAKNVCSTAAAGSTMVWLGADWAGWPVAYLSRALALRWRWRLEDDRIGMPSLVVVDGFSSRRLLDELPGLLAQLGVADLVVLNPLVLNPLVGGASAVRRCIVRAWRAAAPPVVVGPVHVLELREGELETVSHLLPFAGRR